MVRDREEKTDQSRLFFTPVLYQSTPVVYQILTHTVHHRRGAQSSLVSPVPARRVAALSAMRQQRPVELASSPCSGISFTRATYRYDYTLCPAPAGALAKCGNVAAARQMKGHEQPGLETVFTLACDTACVAETSFSTFTLRLLSV